jgi:hypothetical protein
MLQIIHVYSKSQAYSINEKTFMFILWQEKKIYIFLNNYITHNNDNNIISMETTIESSGI